MTTTNEVIQQLIIGQRIQNTLHVIDIFFSMYHEIGNAKSILLNPPCNCHEGHANHNIIRKVGDWADYVSLLWRKGIVDAQLLKELGIDQILVDICNHLEKKEESAALLKREWRNLAEFSMTCSYGPADKD